MVVEKREFWVARLECTEVRSYVPEYEALLDAVKCIDGVFRLPGLPRVIRSFDRDAYEVWCDTESARDQVATAIERIEAKQ